MAGVLTGDTPILTLSNTPVTDQLGQDSSHQNCSLWFSPNVGASNPTRFHNSVVKKLIDWSNREQLPEQCGRHRMKLPHISLAGEFDF
jgi:hypothetical protein